MRTQIGGTGRNMLFCTVYVMVLYGFLYRWFLAFLQPLFYFKGLFHSSGGCGNEKESGQIHISRGCITSILLETPNIKKNKLVCNV